MSDFKIGLSKATEFLNDSGREFKLLFEHGSLEVELYKPNKIDKQSPHDRDEIYVIAEGSGSFQYENQYTKIKKGDFLFVPAGVAHFFFDFTPDFSTWVFFFGPKGGETSIIKNYS